MLNLHVKYTAALIALFTWWLLEHLAKYIPVHYALKMDRQGFRFNFD